MKLTTILIMLACLSARATALSQKLNLDVRNVSVEEIFNQIKQQTNLHFFYEKGVLEGLPKVSLHVENSSVTDVLNKCFKGQPITYYISQNTVGIKRKPAQAVDQVMIAPQPILIRGKVTDSTGTALIGVSIYLKGTRIGTTTDQHGNYALQLPDEHGSLIFAYIGYESKEIEVTDNPVQNVQLKYRVANLDQMVVIGYGSQRKSDVTGAIGSVDQKTIEKSGVTSIDQVLQGRVAGVQMTNNTGLPGGGTSIQIRGLGSINSTNEPIFVIDGVIMSSGTGEYTSNAFSFINPADIEKIEILKDASATAIYGSQGANGVILITTKQGKIGAPSINFEARTGRQNLQKYLPMMNLPQYATHLNDLYSLFGWGVNEYFIDPSYLGEGTNWQKVLFQPSYMSSYDLSASGGTSNTTYNLSGGYLDQQGVAAGSGFKRISFGASVNTKVKPWIKLGGSVKLSQTRQVTTISDQGIINSALRQSPAVPAVNLDGTYGGPEDVNDDLSNPYALAKLIDNHNVQYNVLGNSFVELNPVEWLSFKSEFSTNINQRTNHYFIPTYELGFRVNSQITNKTSQSIATYWTWRNILTANKTFAKRHRTTLMLGQEMSEYKNDYLQGLRYGGSNQLSDLDAGDLANNVASGNSSRNTRESYFGRVNYSFDNRYVLTATLRNDGSSNFAEGKKWGWFPSAAFAWKIKDEHFMRNVDFINNLKLRLGYGKVGNSNIRQFAYAAMLTNVPTIWGTGHTVANVPNPDVTWESTSSYNIGLDAAILKNRIGLTVDLYQKKTDNLLLALTLPAITGTSGTGSASAPWGNIGSISNKGIEITLNTVNIDKKNFKWESTIIYTRNKNKVLSLDAINSQINTTFDISGASNIVTRTEPGRSIGEFYGYKVIGRINSASDIYDADGNVKIALPENQALDQVTGIGVGDLIWDDYNKDGVINEEDRQYIGSPLPKFTYGITNTFTYKQLSLSFLLQGSVGNKILNLMNTYIEDPRSRGNLTYRGGFDYAKVSKIDPDGSDNDVSNFEVTGGDTYMFRMGVNNANANTRISDHYIESGTYMRMQNIALSYSLPVKYANKVGVKSLELSAAVQNAFTITGYSGFDPEIGMTKSQYSTSGQSALLNGIDYGRYPTARNMSLTLKIGL